MTPQKIEKKMGPEETLQYMYIVWKIEAAL
jgi:hypothetical protein